MSIRGGLAVLVLAQAAHSIEECVGRLWESHPLARFVAGLISADLARGFIIGNVLVVGIGVGCVLGPMRRHGPLAISVGWFWVVVETVNAIGHTLWSLLSKQYTPGLGTAPLLLLAAWYLARQLRGVAQPGIADASSGAG